MVCDVKVVGSNPNSSWSNLVREEVIMAGVSLYIDESMIGDL